MSAIGERLKIAHCSFTTREHTSFLTAAGETTNRQIPNKKFVLIMKRSSKAPGVCCFRRFIERTLIFTAF